MANVGRVLWGYEPTLTAHRFTVTCSFRSVLLEIVRKSFHGAIFTSFAFFRLSRRKLPGRRELIASEKLTFSLYIPKLTLLFIYNFQYNLLYFYILLYSFIIKTFFHYYIFSFIYFIFCRLCSYELRTLDIKFGL